MRSGIKKTLILLLVIYSQGVIAEPIMTTSAGQYNYFFNGKSLRSALQDVAQNNGLEITFSPLIASNILMQKINGRFSALQMEDMLTKLGKQYGFNWFIYSGKLYITSSSNITSKIEVAPQDMGSIRINLNQMGLYDGRFGYSELPAEDRLLITGPKEYVDLITQQIRSLNISPVNQQFAVYRLKYANVADMQFVFNNQQIIIPGIASILRGLLQNSQTSAKSGANRLNSQVTELLKNTSTPQSKADNKTPIAQNTLNQISQPSETSSASGSSSYPTIQEDDRLNTIIIRDKTNNLALYKNLIDSLDVPAPLIQVEVMIIKVDQDKLNQAGVNWWLSGGNAAVGFGAGNLNNGSVTNALASSYNQINPGQLVISDALSFSNSLQYLEQNSYAQTVAKPSLATIDNIPAIVNITKSFYYGATPTQSADSAYGGLQINQALQVTPHVIFDGQSRNIKLSIVLDDGSIDQMGNNATPSTTQSQINSQAIIKEGQSIILAGYTRDVIKDTETKVPGLSDIPLIGLLFKSTSKISHKETTLYLVTPKIVWDKDTYKLSNYVTIGGNKVDIKDDYQITGGKPTQAPTNSAAKRITPANF